MARAPFTSMDRKNTIERGATWGTAIDTAPIVLPTGALEFDVPITEHRPDRARGHRYLSAPDVWNDNSAQIVTARFSCPATPNLLALLIPGVWQKSTDYSGAAGTGTAVVYTYAIQDAGTLPMIATSDEGYFFTLVREDPDRKGERLASAVLTSLTLSYNPIENDGVLYLQAEFIGIGYEVLSSAVTGTLSYSDLANVYKFSTKSEADFAGSDFLAECYGWSITLANGAKFVADDPNGEVIFPTWETSGSFMMLHDGDVDFRSTWYADAVAATGNLLKLGIGTVGSAGAGVAQGGDLYFGIPIIGTGDPQMDMSEGDMVTYSWVAVQGTTDPSIKLGTGASA